MMVQLPVYARSDVMGVAITADGGGCGQTHSRPVFDGAPVKTWKLDCPYCEQALKDDPCWAGDVLSIPLNPDEERVTAKLEAEGDRVMHQVSAALASASIQGIRTAQMGEADALAKQQDTENLRRQYEETLAEVRRLQQMIEARPAAEPVVTGRAVSTQDHFKDPFKDPFPLPPVISGTPDGKIIPPITAGQQCPDCGGPLRKTGARGPVPKKCADCRKARAKV
jgi:hypothetical protein